MVSRQCRKERQNNKHTIFSKQIQYAIIKNLISGRPYKVFHLPHSTGKMIPGQNDPPQHYHNMRIQTTDKRGKKAKFTNDHKDYVIELAKADPRITNKMIRELFEANFNQTVSVGKVSEWLHQGNLFYGKPIVIQDLKDYQIIARYNFAIETLMLPVEFFSHVTFSDESRFCTNPDSMRIYRERGSFEDKYCSTHTKFAASCMVWG